MYMYVYLPVLLSKLAGGNVWFMKYVAREILKWHPYIYMYVQCEIIWGAFG